MKKLLVGLLMLIPLLIVAAVLLITDVVLITPDISVTSVEIVDEYQVGVEDVTIENFVAGETQYLLYASVTPKKATNRKVNWTINDESSFDPSYEGHLAEVHVKDLVATITIYASGTFRVEAKSDDGGYTDSCTFTVKSGVAKTGFIVYNENILGDNATLNISTDEIKKLDACARPTDVDIEYIKWSSSDESVLKIDANGVIVPKKTGTAIVTMQIKSLDGLDKSKNQKIVAPVITKTLTVNVADGAFKVASLNVCGTDRVALSALGASEANFVASSSSNASIVGTELVFSADTGKAVFSKDGKSITVNKYADANKILFENADTIANTTIIIGKIPYQLNVINALDGTNAQNITYSSKNPTVATIDAKTGLINAISEGEVVFSAQKGSGEIIEIAFSVKEPVIYFSLEQDTKAGIANDYVYGNYWYNDDLTLTTARQIKVVTPVALVDKFDHFDWAVESDDNIASIDQNGVITIRDFAEKERKNVTVSATAKYTSYSCDNITRTYTFSVMQGVNVKSQEEVIDATSKAQYEVFVQKSIRFRTDWNYKLAILIVTKDLYGNGYTFDWKHIDSSDTEVEDNDVEGASIMNCYGPVNDGGTDYLTISNIRVRSSMLKDGTSIASDKFKHYCVKTNGRVQVKYCYLEYAENCCKVDGFYSDDYRHNFTEDEEAKKVKIIEKTHQTEIPDTIIEGCIMSNSSKFALFCWNDIPFPYVKIKNCVFGQSAIPSIGYYTKNNEGIDPDDYYGLLEFEGFCRIYNWKQDVNMDLCGDITGTPAIDNILRNLINESLGNQKFQKYFKNQNGIKYMHCGIMLNGFDHRSDVRLIGDVEENGFVEFKIDYEELLEGNRTLKNLLGSSLYPSYMWGYYGDETPVQCTETLTISEELYKMLREGDPDFGK